MEKDDEAARKARAESLMQEIARRSSPPSETGPKESEAEDKQTSKEKDVEESPPAESPRDFIHRRMHELDHEKKD